MALVLKNLLVNARNVRDVGSTPPLNMGQGDPLEQEMATHSSILAWEIPWTEMPGRHGIIKVRHDLVTKQHSIYIVDSLTLNLCHNKLRPEA